MGGNDNTCGSLNVYKGSEGVEMDAQGSYLTIGSNPHLSFPTIAKKKVRNYPSTLVNSGLYRDKLGSPLKNNIGKIMLWTHILSPYVCTVIGSDLKK